MPERGTPDVAKDRESQAPYPCTGQLVALHVVPANGIRDAGAGAVVGRVDAANARDLDRPPDLVRPGDGECRPGAGYVGVQARPEVAGDPGLASVGWHVARRRGSVAEADLAEEASKAAVRSAAGHVFHVVKDVFGLSRTRLKGRAKVEQQAAAAAPRPA